MDAVVVLVFNDGGVDNMAADGCNTFMLMLLLYIL